MPRIVYKFFFPFLSLACVNSGFAAKFDSETSIRTQSVFANNPPNRAIFPNRSDTAQQAFLRESFIMGFLRRFRLETNAYLLASGSSGKSSFLGVLFNSTDESNRSSYLERHWHNTEVNDGFLTFDRLALHSNYKFLRFSLGRFPVDLSVGSVFRPNDLFAPFRGQTMYRKYKPGVDAAELEIALGQLSRLNIVGVRGYKNQFTLARINSKVPEKHNEFSYERSSVIARATTNFLGSEWGILGGKHSYYDLYGFSFQGDLGEIVGVRAEGHQRNHRSAETSSTEASLGLESRVFESFILAGEFFFHGAGYAEASEYREALDSSSGETQIYYLGKNYSALSVTYEITPLATLRLIDIANWTDRSGLFVTNLSYSLAENADITFATNTRRGEGPVIETQNGSEVTVPKSEYGNYPNLFSVETNVYF